MTTIAYIRISTDKQDGQGQQLAILEWANAHRTPIDETMTVQMSTRRSAIDRRLGELLDRVQPGDHIIAAELSRLGRSTAEVLTLINELLQREVRVTILKQNLDITAHDVQSKVMVTMFALFSELERDLISQRTREALAARKAKGVRLGKPVGTIQESQFDAHQEQIVELLKLGVSVRTIAKKHLYCSHSSLNAYINSRNLR